MSKGEEGSMFKFIAGLVSGVVSGIVLGLLIAPKQGSKMREELKDKFLELQELSCGQADRVATTIQEKASRISTKLDELVKRGSEVLIQDEIQ